MSTAAAPTTRVESVLQRAELELWRDNIDGALDLLARAHTLAPDHRYAARAEEIRSWLRHLESRGAYAAAYEEYYRPSKGRLDLKRLERDVRILLGRKTRKTVRRVVEYPEYQWLEREIIERRPARVLDAGCGEGRIALCLGHRCPSIRVTAVEVSATNVGIARRLNRFRNVAFQHGLVEDVVGAMAPGSFDLGYSFAVLEHREGVAEVEGPWRHGADHVLDEAVLKRHVAEAIEPPRDADVGRRDLDGRHPDGRTPVAETQGDPALAASGIEHARGSPLDDLALEPLVFRIVDDAPHGLPRLATEQDSHVTLEPLEVEATLAPPIIFLVGGRVRPTAFEVAEPRPNLLGAGGISVIGRERVGARQQVERAVDVVTPELELRPLQDRLHASRRSCRSRHRQLRSWARWRCGRRQACQRRS